MKKLERDALLADREAVRRIIGTIDAEDVLGRMSFQSRLEQINDQLAHLEQIVENTASVALFFGGEPVIGSESIDADFSAKILTAFQAMVSKRLASDEFGDLGDRGPLPHGRHAPFAISELLRGSMG